MIEAEHIKSYIDSSWAGDPAVPFCMRIIDFITTNPENNSKMLTYSALAKVVGVSDVGDDLIRAVGILSARFDALIMHFVFIDEYGTPHYINSEEAADYLVGDDIVHPIIGDKVREAGKSLFPYYEGNRSYLMQVHCA